MKRKDYLKGGLADNDDYSKIDPVQRKAGKKVEREHSFKPAIRDEIQGDHTHEIPDYYIPRLDTMESTYELEQEYKDENNFIGTNKSQTEIILGMKNKDGKFVKVIIPVDERKLEKPVKVRDHNRQTGHVDQYYRSERMR